MKHVSENLQGASPEASCAHGGTIISVVENKGVICQNYYEAGTHHRVNDSGSVLPESEKPATATTQALAEESPQAAVLAEESPQAAALVEESLSATQVPTQRGDEKLLELLQGAVYSKWGDDSPSYLPDDDQLAEMISRLSKAHNAREIWRILSVYLKRIPREQLVRIVKKREFIIVLEPLLDNYCFSRDLRNLSDCIGHELDKNK